MYLARFEYETLCLRTAAIGFSSSRRDAAHGLARVLAPYPRVDAALRVTASCAATHRLLLLCAPDAYRAELQACHADVLRSLPLADVWLPADGGEFDLLSGVRTRHQLRVNHDGYRHGGLTLGCDFKLYAALGNDLPAASISYQVNLRTHRPNAETERRVLKYLARLDLERPFTDRVRMMQRTLAERLRQPGWVGDEYLAADDPRDLERRLQRMRAFFAETTSKLLVFATNGRFYSLDVAKLPGGRGHGEPIRMFIDMEQETAIVSVRVAFSTAVAAVRPRRAAARRASSSATPRPTTTPPSRSARNLRRRA